MLVCATRYRLGDVIDLDLHWFRQWPVGLLVDSRKDLHKIYTDMQATACKVKDWFVSNPLTLNPPKTSYSIIIPQEGKSQECKII